MKILRLLKSWVTYWIKRLKDSFLLVIVKIVKLLKESPIRFTIIIFGLMKKIFAILFLPLSVLSQNSASYKAWKYGDMDYPMDHQGDLLTRSLFVIGFVIFVIYWGLRIYDWIKRDF